MRWTRPAVRVARLLVCPATRADRRCDTLILGTHPLVVATDGRGVRSVRIRRVRTRYIHSMQSILGARASRAGQLIAGSDDVIFGASCSGRSSANTTLRLP